LAPRLDPGKLAGRSLGSALDGIFGPWEASSGIGANGPVNITPTDRDWIGAAIAARRRLAPLTTLILSGAVRLLDMDGREIPKRVIAARRWRLYRDGDGVERLVVNDELWERIVAEYFGPVFASPEGGKGKGKGGNKRKATDHEIERGIEIARSNGFNWSAAARQLFDELNPKPVITNPEHKRWDLDRGQYVNRMRTTLSEACKDKPSR
jgi:hypothetical protein